MTMFWKKRLLGEVDLVSVGLAVTKEVEGSHDFFFFSAAKNSGNLSGRRDIK